MRRNLKQRIISLLTALMLVLPTFFGGNVEMYQVQAEGETSVTLAPDGTAGNTDTVYINLSAGTKSGKYQPVEGSVKLDGEELNNEWELDYTFTYAGWSNVYYIKLTHIDTSKTLTFQEGSVLTIGGTFKNTDDSTIINIEETSIKCKSPEAAWEVYIPTTEVTLTPDGTAGNTDTVYINLSAGSKSGKYQPVEGSVKLDGAELNNEWELDYTFTYAGWSNVYYIKLTHIDTSKELTFKEGSILTIGGTFKNTDDSTIINIEEISIECKLSTEKWEIWVEKTPLDAPAISLLDHTVSWAAVANATSYEINVDGEKKAVTTETTFDLSTLSLGGRIYQITVTAIGGNDKIPATSNAVTYTVPATKITVTVAEENSVNTNSKVLYLKFAGSAISEKYAPVDGYVKLDGTTLRYTVDGYNEIDYAFNRNGNDGSFYLQITNTLGTSYAFKDKSIVTIGGTFKGTDGSIIDIEETHLVCEFVDSVYNWNDVFLNTPGDLNGDGEWTSVDLVRMKRYIANGIASTYPQVTELIGDDTVNDDDVAVLREMIVGAAQYVDGQKLSKYISDKSINIFADGPVVHNDLKLLKNYFNAGFTTLLMTEDYLGEGVIDTDNNYTMTKPDGTLDADYVACVTLAMKYGDVMVRNYGNKADYFTEDTFRELYDLGVRQFYIWDEPTPANNGTILGGNKTDGDIPSVKSLATTFQKTLPEDTMFHVNLLPSYGTGKVNSFNGTIGHAAYVDQYVSDVVSQLGTHQQTLSVDNYPLLATGKIRTSYLSDLWYIANKAKSVKAEGKDITVNYCIQSFKENGNEELRVPETRADISFQTNTGLALGAQSFEYFEYYDWTDTDTITGIVVNGLYDQVKSVNRELKAWDHIFLSFDWQGVKTYNVDSSYKEDVTELSSLAQVAISADQATLVGEYQYKDADYGYMITNFTDPSQNTTDNVTVSVEAGKKVLVYQNGIGRYMTADSEGYLSFALGAGEAVFVIVEK